jgi:hypothetical protein
VGTITNTSKSIIYLNERFLTVKVPSEIEGPHGDAHTSWRGFMPAAYHGEEEEFRYNATLALKPGQATPIYWSINPSEALSKVRRERSESLPSPWIALRGLYHDVSVELQYLLFNPGTYKLVVSANYWDTPVPPFKGTPRVVTETLNVDFTAPQSVLLFGAALGGLIGYILLPKARRGLPKFALTWRRVFAIVPLVLLGVIGAMLLAIVVSILLARVASNQFLLQVTVSDLWGAIIIGFVSTYLGTEVLNRFFRVGSENGSAGRDGDQAGSGTASQPAPQLAGQHPPNTAGAAVIVQPPAKQGGQRK